MCASAVKTMTGLKDRNVFAGPEAERGPGCELELESLCPAADNCLFSVEIALNNRAVTHA